MHCTAGLYRAHSLHLHLHVVGATQDILSLLISLCRVMLEMGCYLLNGVLMTLSYECYCQTEGWMSREDLTLFNPTRSFSSQIPEECFYKLLLLIKDSKFETCLLQGFVISRDILGFRERRILFLWSGLRLALEVWQHLLSCIQLPRFILKYKIFIDM